MAKTRRNISKKWTAEEIDRMAHDQDTSKADDLAARLGGAVAALWNANEDPKNAEDKANTEAKPADVE